MLWLILVPFIFSISPGFRVGLSGVPASPAAATAAGTGSVLGAAERSSVLRDRYRTRLFTRHFCSHQMILFH